MWLIVRRDLVSLRERAVIHEIEDWIVFETECYGAGEVCFAAAECNLTE